VAPVTDDEEVRERRARGERVTRCAFCRALVADPLHWGHEERHIRAGEHPLPEQGR
jgi:hypothetical protein